MSPLAPLHRWATDSQARARRNALSANTALAARRLEREEVESYLRSRGEIDVPAPATSTEDGRLAR